MGKKALLAAFPCYQPATLMIIIKWELARVREALADSGEAIWSRMRTLRCCVTVGIEFGLSGTAVRWILSEVEKRHSRPVAQVRPQAAVGAMTRKQELDDNYLWALKRLRATVEDIGWGGGQRREAVFNSKELSFPKAGDFTVSVWSGPVDQMQGRAFWGLRRSAKCPPILLLQQNLWADSGSGSRPSV